MHDRMAKVCIGAEQRSSFRGAAPDTQSTHPIDHHVGQQPRIIRMHSNLSQTELGQKVSLINQQIELYESGGNHMTASVLYEVANSLNVPFAHFFEALPLAESASLEGGLSEIGERIPDLPTSEGRHFVKEIVRLPPRLRTRAFTRIKLAADDRDDTAEQRDLGGLKRSIDSEEANHEHGLHRD